MKGKGKRHEYCVLPSASLINGRNGKFSRENINRTNVLFVCGFLCQLFLLTLNLFLIIFFVIFILLTVRRTCNGMLCGSFKLTRQTITCPIIVVCDCVRHKGEVRKYFFKRHTQLYLELRCLR